MTAGGHSQPLSAVTSQIQLYNIMPKIESLIFSSGQSASMESPPASHAHTCRQNNIDVHWQMPIASMTGIQQTVIIGTQYFRCCRLGKAYSALILC